MSGLVLFLVSVLTLAAVYVVLSLALNIETGVDGLWDLGIVSFFCAGAYAYAIFTAAPPGEYSKYHFGLNMPIIVGVIAAGIVGMILAYLIGTPSLKLKNEYFLITTFAFAEVINQIVTNEAWLTNGVAGLYQLPQPFKEMFSPSVYSFVLLALLVCAAAVVFYVAERFTRSPFGRSLKALRENEPLAITAGLNPFHFHIRSFIIAGGIAGVAGAFYVWYNTVAMPPMFSADITFFAWTAIVIGGMGNNRGVTLGALIFVLAGESLRFFHLSSEMAIRVASIRLAIIGLLLILILKWRPEGIMPERKEKY